MKTRRDSGESGSGEEGGGPAGHRNGFRGCRARAGTVTNRAIPTVGEQLRADRERQQLTVHQVADATNIKTDHVRALEASEWGAFAAPGERPSDPELLDWLASDFMRHGWKVKRLHKLIMTSTAYRQSSARSPGGEDCDPEDRLLWRKPVQRLDAEAIRDAVLAVSGSLDPKMSGAPVPVRPDVNGQIVVGEDKTTGDNKMPVEGSLGGEEFRRSVYIQARRSRPLAMLHAFDAPVMEVNCERRQSSTVATQSLMLMNSGFLLDQAERFARRLQSEAGDEHAAQVRRAWQLAFDRPPRAGELTDATTFLARQVSFLSTQAAPLLDAAKPAKPAEGSKTSPPKPEPEQQALTDLCQALLSANEFLYVD